MGRCLRVGLWGRGRRGRAKRMDFSLIRGVSGVKVFEIRRFGRSRFVYDKRVFEILILKLNCGTTDER
jgi:hypothetical protein